jgi:hypothetical protein
MPTACRQTTKQTGLRSLLVEVKRLWIELGSKRLDLGFINRIGSRTAVQRKGPPSKGGHQHDDRCYEA